MANIKSQIKRNRQNEKRRLANRVFRGEARLAVKGARSAFENSAPESKEELLKAISALDKAVEKGVLHKNNAARRKSRLMKAFAGVKPVEVNKVEEPEAATAPVEADVKPRRRARAKVEPKAEVPVEIKAAPAKKAAVKKTTTRKKTSPKPETEEKG